MLNSYPGMLTLAQYHLGDSFATSFGNSRANFYAISGTPTAWFDGCVQHVGASSYSQILAEYTTTYNACCQVPTDVIISVTGTQAYSTTYTIRARIAIEPGGTAKTLRIHMANVLDHWPASPSYHRNCVRAGATPQDVTLQPGESIVVARSFVFDDASWAHQNDIRILVWAQAPSGSAPAGIFQAAQMNWPFPPDCNENGLPDATDIAAGGSLDCNGNSVPDECELLSHDCNLNGVPDDCDIAGGSALDCNSNGVPDECELAEDDCNANGIPDGCDIAAGTSQDSDGNGVPDECEYLTGDLNCDRAVTFADINPFVTRLSSPVIYEYIYPNCPDANGDINGSGVVDFEDINPFVALLASQ